MAEQRQVGCDGAPSGGSGAGLEDRADPARRARLVFYLLLARGTGLTFTRGHGSEEVAALFASTMELSTTLGLPAARFASVLRFAEDTTCFGGNSPKPESGRRSCKRSPKQRATPC